MPSESKKKVAMIDCGQAKAQRMYESAKASSATVVTVSMTPTLVERLNSVDIRTALPLAVHNLLRTAAQTLIAQEREIERLRRYEKGFWELQEMSQIEADDLWIYAGEDVVDHREFPNAGAILSERHAAALLRESSPAQNPAQETEGGK